MSESLGTAVLELAADAGQLNTSLVKAKLDSVKQFTEAGKLSKAALVAGIAAGAVLAGAALYKVGEAFDDAYDTIAAGTGKTGTQLEGLKDDFRAVVRDVPASFGDASAAITDVNKRLGLTGKPLQERAKQFLELSRITGTDVKGNIESVSKAFRDWAIPVAAQGKTLDGFFRVSQKTGISVSDLASSVQRFGSPLRQLGFSLDEAAAMFGIFEAAGVNSQTMVPGFKMAIKNLIQPTDELRARLDRLGVDTSKPEQALKRLIAIIGDKGVPASKRMSLAMEVFGARAGADMAEAIQQGRFELDGMVKTFDKGKGTILDTAKNTNDFSDKLQILKNRGMLALEGPAAAVFDGMSKLADVIIVLTDKFAALPGPVKKTIAIVAGVGVAIVGLVFAFTKLKAAFLAIRALMLANPYVAIIAATIAIAVLIVSNWDTIKGFLTKVWNAIKSAAGAVWNAIKGVIETYLGAIKAVFLTYVGIYKTILSTAWNVIKSAASAVWRAIKGAIEGYLGAIKSAFRTYVGIYKTVLSAAWNAIKSAAGAAWQRVKQLITGPVSAVVGEVKERFGNLKTNLSNVWGAIKDATSGAWQRFKELILGPVASVVDGVKDRVGRVLDVIRDIPGKIKSALGNLGHLLYDTGRAIIAGLAQGILDEFSKLLDKVKGFANKIKSLKGPIDKDRVLLVDEGAAIIEGLERGMESRLGSLLSKVADIAPTIRQTIAPAPASAAAAGHTGPLVNVEHMEVKDGFDERRFASDLAWKVATA